MFEEVIPKNARDALVILGKSKLLKNGYMAGGTALALQFGHRFSYDLDFFTPEEFNENVLVQRIKKVIPEFKLEKLSWRTILGNIKKTRFTLFFYSYPILFPTHNFLGVNIADARDIASMKIAAISDRGTRRDFIDLYFIIRVKKILSLFEAVKLYDKKFETLEQNKMHILKSLEYFADAEQEEMPKMVEKLIWSEVKFFFESEVKKISKKLLKQYMRKTV